MRFWILAAVVASLCVGMTGCSDESTPAPSAPANATASKPSEPAPPPPAPPPPAVPSAAEEPEVAAKQPSTGTSYQSAPPSAATPHPQDGAPATSFSLTEDKSANSANSKTSNLVYTAPNGAAKSSNSAENSAAATDQIKLSAGVALPQTGPDGALMSFSVDYELRGAPGTAPYVLVIDRAQGVSLKKTVRLREKTGNLVVFVSGWRPNEGPFQAHLEDKTGKQVSASLELLGQD